MRHFIFSILLFVFLPSIYTQSHYFQNGQKHLWGNISLEDLSDPPFNDWFAKEYPEVKDQLNPKLLEPLSEMEVTIFLGTWCGDTKRNLPKFFQVWNAANLPQKNIKLIALHNTDSLYKQAPDHVEEKFGIHRVPTFIFHKDGKEIGRITEHPRTDMYTDLAQIATGLSPIPRYQAVSDLLSYFDLYPMDSLLVKKEMIGKKLSPKVTKPYELTTLARKLWKEGKIAKAEFTYQLSIDLYPYHPISYYYYARFQKVQNNIEKAKELLQEALRKEPDFPNAIAELDKLYKEMEY